MSQIAKSWQISHSVCPQKNQNTTLQWQKLGTETKWRVWAWQSQSNL